MFCAADCAADDVNVRFQAYAAHADRMADVFLAIDDVFLRLLVEHALIGRNRDRASGIEHMVDIGGGHFTIADRCGAV